MPDQTPAIQTIVQRLEKIEKQNRTMKCAGVAILIVVGAIVLMGQASPQSRIINANAFVLKDAGGKMRASLRMDTILDAPELKLYDANGKSRVEIFADAKHSSIWVSDTTQNVSASLMVDQNGPGLDLSGAGATRAALYVAPEGPGLSLYDSGGKRRVGMGVTADASNVVLYDSQERARAGLAVKSAGPLFSVFDADGKALWSAPNATELPRPSTEERKPRIFIEAWYVGKFFKPSRASEPMEEMAAFAQECSQAVATTDKEKADYVLRLEHHSGVGVSEENFYRYSLFDREGSEIATEANPELGGAVNVACNTIVRNWKTTNH